MSHPDITATTTVPDYSKSPFLFPVNGHDGASAPDLGTVRSKAEGHLADQVSQTGSGGCAKHGEVRPGEPAVLEARELGLGLRQACFAWTCVEVAFQNGEFLVRDSKDPNSPLLKFDRLEWSAFVDGVKAGEFDVPASDTDSWDFRAPTVPVGSI